MVDYIHVLLRRIYIVKRANYYVVNCISAQIYESVQGVGDSQKNTCYLIINFFHIIVLKNNILLQHLSCSQELTFIFA